MKHSIIVALLGLGIGCSTPGMIKADAIAGSVHDVCERHDAYVNADPTLTPAQKQLRLRSSSLLVQTVDEAQAAAAGSSSITSK